MAAMIAEVPRPFSLSSAEIRGPIRRALLAWFGRPLENLIGLSKLNKLYHQTRGMDPEQSFLERSLAAMNIGYEVAGEEAARIPKSGPCVVVSNHPFGGLDGILLAAMLRKVRPDCKVMANFLLARIPELSDAMIFVDPFGGKDSAKRNIAGIKRSIEHLRHGGMLVIFPAGEVSHVDLAHRRIADKTWSDTVARIVRRTNAPVLPVFFGGSNGVLFNMLGLIHPMLRTAMLPREFLRKRHTRVPIRVGSPIAYKKLSEFEDDKEMMLYLRMRSYILQTRQAVRQNALDAEKLRHIESMHEPVVAAGDAEAIRAEVRGLPAEALMLESGKYAVYAARAGQIPAALREIGRLREITFRAVHEGTGKSIDLDGFDPAYIHLFAWHKAREEIVGAYRLGPTDEIAIGGRVEWMYTHQFFRYGPKLIQQMGPALELGRSFVRPEYQRAYAPLLLLWRGIGQYVARNPRYQSLFGPVSINREYHGASRHLIMAFLQRTRSSAMSRLIHPINPPRHRVFKKSDVKKYSRVVRDMDEVSELVAEMECDGKGIPILLRQYMKLSAKILGFNIDPDFGDVLDGLMLVNLRDMPPRLLEKFFGPDGVESVLKYQRANPHGGGPAHAVG